METSLVYQQIKDQEKQLAQFLEPLFTRHDAVRAALQYITGLVSKVDRKNTWQLAQEAGLKSPYSFQHLLACAAWNSHALRDHLQVAGIEQKQAGILIIDQTGLSVRCTC
jgi:SRSO17 transposase